MNRQTTPNIITDHAIENKDNDLFQFHSYALSISKLMANKENIAPFTVGILGEWGSGKTSLLKLIMHELATTAETKEANYRKCVPVWFDAWRYNTAESLLLSLTNVMWQRVKEDFSLVHRLFYRLKSPSGKERNWVGMIISFVTQLATIGRVNLDVSKFEKETMFSKRMDFYNEFRKCFNGFVDAYGRKGKETILVVLIDDLDRCVPSKVVELLEAVKVFISSPNCAFIIALDEIVVREAVRAYYMKSGLETVDTTKYLDKMIQVKFSLPPLRQLELDKYVQSLTTVEEEARELLSGVTQFISTNPRKIKHFINQFELQWSILQSASPQTVDRTKLLSWLLINEVSPELFDYVRAQPNDHQRALTMNEVIKFRAAQEEGWLPDEKVVDMITKNEALRKISASLSKYDLQYFPKEMGYYIHLSAPPLLTATRDIRKDIEYTLASLTPKDARVLQLFFGIGKHERLTLEQIAKEYAVKPETVRKWLAIALRKCRHPSRSRRLKDYLDYIPETGELSGEELLIEAIFGTWRITDDFV